MAGAELLKTNQHLAWNILESMIISSDPDDRDTALELLIQSNHPRSHELAKPLLEDQYPYLQFDAADFLQSVYPCEVRSMLKTLMGHDTVWVRQAAQERLGKYASSGIEVE